MFLSPNYDHLKSTQNSTIISDEASYKRKQQDNDKYLKYYKIHFKFHEERFYEHIGDFVMMLKKNSISSIKAILPNLNDVHNYDQLYKMDFNNFGSCFLAKCQNTGKDVVLKHILNTYSKSRTKIILYDIERMLRINCDYIEKMLKHIVVENEGFYSIWYIFDYIPSLSLDIVAQRLHKIIFNYTVSSESDFVHLLYTCNSTLDRSKENFPNYMTILRHLSAQLLYGISYFHETGMIHKYLNPSNIRITMKGILKITDLGIAKHFRRLQYCPRDFIEFGKDFNYLLYKDPIKRIRLGGNYYYLEPHIRQLYSKRKTLSHKLVHSFNFGYHMDYFSCAMIIFELVFGFTYGDVELYKNYSFYKNFHRYELIFFFPDYYMNMFKHFPNLNLAIEDFKNFKLMNLKSFLMNHENGFVDFIIDGLKTDIERWSKYSKTSPKGQYFDFVTLQNDIPFYQEIEFHNLSNNVPVEFYNILRNSGTIDSNVKKKTTRFLSNSEYIYNPLSEDLNSLDSKSYYIPQLKLTNSTSPKKFFNNSSSRITEKVMPKFQHKSHRQRVLHINNSRSEKPLEKIAIIPTKSDKMELSVENKMDQSPNDLIDDIKYRSVFLHKLFDDLENQKTDSEIVDDELHHFMKSQLEKDSFTDLLLFESDNNQRGKALGDSNVTSDLVNKELINDYKISRNKIDKLCSVHSKRQIYNNQSISNTNREKSIKQNTYHGKLITSTDSINLHFNKSHTRGLSADPPYLSEYELNQYKMFDYYRLPKSLSKPCNFDSSTGKLNAVKQNSKSILTAETQEPSRKDPNKLSISQRLEPKVCIKDITASATTGSEISLSPLKGTDNSLNKNKLNTVSDFHCSVFDEVNLKKMSNNYVNYLRKKSNPVPDTSKSFSSSKCVCIDISNTGIKYPPIDSTKQLTNINESNTIRRFIQDKQFKINKVPTRSNLMFRKRRTNQTNDLEGDLGYNHKRGNLMDSSVLKMFPKNTKDKIKTNKDEFTQVNKQNVKPVDPSTLYNKLKHFPRPMIHPMNSVISLTSKECQTRTDVIDSSTICNVVNSILKNAEVQTVRVLSPPENFDLEIDVVRSSDEEARGKSSEKISNKKDQISDSFQTLSESVTSINNSLCDGVERDWVIGYDSFDFLNELEMTHARVTYEKDYAELYSISQEEPIWSNENSLLLLHNNFVEILNESTDQSIELFKGIPTKDYSLVTESLKSENTTQKSVSFRSPIISDIFDSGYQKFSPDETLSLQPKGILKDNTVDLLMDDKDDVSYFYRPKINSYNLEIIDDWLDCEENFEPNNINQQFDLKTIDNSMEILSSDFATTNEPTGSESPVSDKDNFETL